MIADFARAVHRDWRHADDNLKSWVRWGALVLTVECIVALAACIMACLL